MMLRMRSREEGWRGIGRVTASRSLRCPTESSDSSGSQRAQPRPLTFYSLQEKRLYSAERRSVPSAKINTNKKKFRRLLQINARFSTSDSRWFSVYPVESCCWTVTRFTEKRQEILFHSKLFSAILHFQILWRISSNLVESHRWIYTACCSVSVFMREWFHDSLHHMVTFSQSLTSRSIIILIKTLFKSV